MATERARNIRGTRTELGKLVKQTWLKAKDVECEPLTFDDLEIGENFIALPRPGDNSDHAGLLDGTRIFKKIEPVGDACEPLAVPYYNAVRLIDHVLSFMTDGMWVYKVQ